MATDARPDSADEAAAREVLRIYQRYAVEVVERFDLCPWAARSRRTGAARPWVLRQDDPAELADSLAAIDALAGDESVAVALLIYPRFRLGRRDFEHFVRRLRQADAERHEPGDIPFAMAAFHPHAAPDFATPERLIPFIRRSPDPTVQLVRHEALEAVRGDATTGTALADLWMVSPAGREPSPRPPDVRDRIAQNNLATLERVGHTALESILHDIEQDRLASYARVGLPALIRGA